MTGFIQRYGYAPKAEWWKKSEERYCRSDRVIYTINDLKGFEVDLYKRKFNVIEDISNLKDTTGNIEFIPIEHVTLRFLGSVWEYSMDTLKLEKVDIMTQGNEAIFAKSSNMFVFEKNRYIRQFKFDCMIEGDLQNQVYQPIKGLITDSSYLTIKTNNFNQSKKEPRHGDLLYYRNQFWAIEDMTRNYVYTPKEQWFTRFTIKAIYK